jgi:hypothetical protein
MKTVDIFISFCSQFLSDPSFLLYIETKWGDCAVLGQVLFCGNWAGTPCYRLQRQKTQAHKRHKTSIILSSSIHYIHIIDINIETSKSMQYTRGLHKHLRHSEGALKHTYLKYWDRSSTLLFGDGSIQCARARLPIETVANKYHPHHRSYIRICININHFRNTSQVSIYLVYSLEKKARW